ncbi:MAG: HEAT repeat domain-containing protein [Nitrospira sp.]|nr:HEAT repeat domain-containing protein [Nitrospira sp.]
MAESSLNAAQAYLQAILGKPDFTSLPFPTIEENVPFDRLYVSQTVTEEKLEEKLEEKQEGSLSGKSAASSDQAMHQMAMGSVVKQVAVDLWQKLRQDHRVVVTAPAWTGKSTLCKWVVQHCHAKMHWLPIYIPFRNLSQSVHPTLINYLEQEYGPWLGLEGLRVDGHQHDDRISTVSWSRWLYDQWQAGQAILILDGADEEFDRTKRESILSALPTRGTKSIRPRVLLTSRPGGEAGVQGFEKIELQEFTRKQIETLICNCGVLLDAQDKTAKLLREMKGGTKPRAWPFAGRPGHLIQMVVTYVQEGILLAWEEDQMDRIASRRFQVTDRVTPKLEPDDPQPKRQLIEELAFHSLFCRKGQAQTRAQMLDLLTQMIQTRHARQQYEVTTYRPQQASRLLTDLCANSSFLKPTRQGVIEWESVPWLQFFAASHLAQKLEPDTGDPAFHHWAYSPPNEQEPILLSCPICQITLPQFAHYLWRPEWREGLLLIAGVLKETESLLTRLEQEPDDLLNRISILLAQVLGKSKRISEKILHRISRNLLSSSNRFLKISVCRTLGAFRNTAAREVLEYSLTDNDPSCREAAVIALEQLGDPLTRPALEQAIKGVDSQVRFIAMRALADLGDFTLLDHILLSGNDWLDRLDVVKVLRDLKDQAARPTLERALMDRNKVVRDSAAEGLWELGDSKVKELVNRITTSTDDSQFHIRREMLQKLKNQGARLELEQLLMDSKENIKIRVYAAFALESLNDSASISALKSVLSERSSWIQQTELKVRNENPHLKPWEIKNTIMGRDKEAIVVAAIIEVLGDLGIEHRSGLEEVLLNYYENTFVRQQAARALGKLGDPISGPVLGRALADPIGFEQCEAAEALGQLGDPVSLSLLEQTLMSLKARKETRMAAARALGKFGNFAIRPVLEEELVNEEISIRTNAAEFLGELGDSAARPALERALTDVEIPVRIASAQALGKLGEPASCIVLKRALSEEKLGISQEAYQAIQAIYKQNWMIDQRFFPDGSVLPFP